MMNISIILCTFNRCHSLAKALESVAVLELPPSTEWEVLVVDNNSSDPTREVVAGFCRRYPERFRYVFEPRPGKSYALNSGIQNARGEILAFLDDDVTVGPSWLQNLTAPLSDQELAGTGGPVVLNWHCPVPRWLPSEGPYAMAPLAKFDPGTGPGLFTQPPIGTNMAFRKCMFEAYGLFRTDLGPSPDRDVPRPNEDIEFGSRLLAGGERLYYEPSAVVIHPVMEERLTKRYFLDWWFDKGRADIRVFGIPPDVERKVRGVPLYLIRRTVVWTVRWMLAIGPRNRFYCKFLVWFRAGEIVECYRKSRV